MQSKKRHMQVMQLVILVLTLCFVVGRSQGAAAPQEQNGRCMIAVPQEWGEYVDSGSYGVVFRDSNGTLRFVNRFPCGLEGAPNVALEIRRK